MIRDVKDLSKDFNIPLRGIIHIGAHYGQEYEEYLNASIIDMMFFEPLKENYDVLIGRIPQNDHIKCYQLALGNEVGKHEMFVEKANQSMSSSLLEPVVHLKQYPWITFDYKESVNINKLDNIDFDRRLFNILNIDVQGYESEVLRGAKTTLNTIDAIFIELNAVEMYKGCALVQDIDNILIDFKRVADNVVHNGNWGEGLYIRNDYIH